MSNFDNPSPVDPIPGPDWGLTLKWGEENRFQKYGINVLYKRSYRYTSSPRSIHGMIVREGNRLGSDMELRIMGKELGIILGMASVLAPRSPISDLEETSFGRLGIQLGSFSFYFSND